MQRGSQGHRVEESSQETNSQGNFQEGIYQGPQDPGTGRALLGEFQDHCRAACRAEDIQKKENNETNETNEFESCETKSEAASNSASVEAVTIGMQEDDFKDEVQPMWSDASDHSTSVSPSAVSPAGKKKVKVVKKVAPKAKVKGGKARAVGVDDKAGAFGVDDEVF